MLIGDILRQSAARHPEKPALIAGRERLSYRALDLAANRIANLVRGLGVRKGQRVALMSRNRWEYIAIHFGVARAGAILVHISPAYGPAEIAHILKQTKPVLAFGGRLDVKRTVDIDKQLPRLMARASDAPPRVALDPADPFGMTFTGGTTGFPKGALVSHRARIASAFTTAVEHGLSGRDVVGLPMPLYHAAGLLVWGQAALLAGATCVLMGRWDPDELVALTERERITNVTLVPVQLHDLLGAATFSRERLASLTTLATGGAPKQAGLMAAFLERMPHAAFIDHYGQSEVGPIALLKSWHPADKADSIGLPGIGLEVKVAGPDGRPVAPGEIGEIAVRGECLMTGYYRNEAETEAYFRTGDGWGWSGDLATVDRDGFITLAGRAKDMIISGGINVYPREIEVVLEAHPAVSECTAFGVPDDRWGESLVAYVVLRDGEGIEPEALIAHCGAQLARYKRPRAVKLVDAIPKTASGKVLKHRLREAYLAGR